MPVTSIMSTKIVKLGPTAKVSEGLRMMHDRHVRTLAVVNDDGQFIGLFGIRQVVHLLLPKAAQIENGLTDLSFMPEDLGNFYHRIKEVGNKPVADFLAKKEDLLICKPTTQLPELLELLHLSFNTSLPVVVVEGENNRLIGMVSGWDVLEKLVMNVFNHKAGNGGEAD